MQIYCASKSNHSPWWHVLVRTHRNGKTCRSLIHPLNSFIISVQDQRWVSVGSLLGNDDPFENQRRLSAIISSREICPLPEVGVSKMDTHPRFCPNNFNNSPFLKVVTYNNTAAS